MQDERTGGDRPVAGGGENDLAATPFEQGSGQVLEGFAAYRMMQRRIADAARRGIMLPFFQPREGVSAGTIRWDGRELINFSGYNYLGLSGHPAVSRAAKDAIDEYGTSASASRIVAGEIALHGVLEITGCRLSGARVLSFPHDDWAGLDAALTPLRPDARRGLLVAEGIYSMDGDVIDIERAVGAKRHHDLLLMVDEAHSFGTLGPTGRGVCERAGLPPSSIDIHMGTLSKTLASCGGYIAGDRSLIDYLRYTAPGFLFSVGLSPPDTAAALAALEILETEPDRPRRLQDCSRLFRRIAREAGLAVGGTEESPVVPLILGNSELCVRLSLALLDHGINVQPIIYPAVAEDAARLRFFITVNHSEEQFRTTIPLVTRELESLRTAVA